MTKKKKATALEQAIRRIHEVKDAALGHEACIEIAEDVAALILDAAKSAQTPKEKKREEQLAKLIQDSKSKTLVSHILDSCFRTSDPKRLIDQLSYLLKEYGIPPFLPFWQKLGLKLFCRVGWMMPKLSCYFAKKIVQKEVEDVIAPGEAGLLEKRLKSIKKSQIQINLNRLGEAILGENEARARLEQNIEDLKNPHIDVISVKISSIASQISLVGYKISLRRLKKALRRLFRQADAHKKFVNLDMEEYKDLRLTVQLFQEVLSEEEFAGLSCGIALQSYIPDSYKILEELTSWAIQRVESGGAPIKVRIVKGANLGMERVEASLKEWPEATFHKKADADANFKKMVQFALKKEHAKAVHIGIGSHNLFDIAYALILASSQGINNYLTIEMLAGMAPHITRVMPKIWKKVLLYLPCAKKEEFHNAIAYLMRRLDENTAPNNFLTHLFSLEASSREWQEQKELFKEACLNVDSIKSVPQRTQNRNAHQIQPTPSGHFRNEPDTDFSLAQNQLWAESIVNEWEVNYHEINLVVGGHNLVSSELGQGIDPSRPTCKIHTHFLAQEYQINVACAFAKNHATLWGQVPLKERIELLLRVANNIRSNRKKLVGSMMQEVAKPIIEGDAEVSEAIDFIEYYTKEIDNHPHAENLFSQKKASLVLTPWNFPISIPTSAIVSNLLAGNSVIFKPAPEALLVGWLLAQNFWQAGISKEVLQFIACRDEPIGSMLVSDPRIDQVILTGSTATAKSFIHRRPTITLFAETGGKNSLIVTKVSDRDLAVKDAIQSAFGYSGQKCSALSLLILEEEVYNSESFRGQLYDAASSLVCSSSYNLNCQVNPLIRPPSPHLLRALRTLDPGESWLLEPRPDPTNTQLWTPGIKLGVKPSSFMHQTELFGPVLGVMSAKNLQEAIDFANGTPYGLTAGIHSLDPRELEYWKKHIVAGNLYINRPITGAIVERQPFGGTKASSFGLGMKVGGPNYLLQLAKCQNIPAFGHHDLSPDIMDLENALMQLVRSQKEQSHFQKACSSFTFWWDNYFSRPRMLRRLVGQDNILEYRNREQIFLFIQDADSIVDIFLLFAACRIAGCKLQCGLSFKMMRRLFRQGPLEPLFTKFNWQFGSQEDAARWIQATPQAHVRTLTALPHDILEAITPTLACLDTSLPCANGRLELIHYLREVAISHDYHRYGSNLQAKG